MTLLLSLLVGCHLLQTNPQVPEFPSKWKDISVLSGETYQGETIARLDGISGDAQYRGTGFTLANPPVDRDLHFTIYMRQAPDAKNLPMIRSFAYSAKHEMLQSSFSYVALKDRNWFKGDCNLVVPFGTTALVVWVFNLTKNPMDLSKPSMELGQPHMVLLGSSGILRASSQAVVTGTSGEIRFPVPAPYRDQAPLSFKVVATPPSGLKSWKLEQRSPNNWICVAQVKPPQGKNLIVRWESLVLIHKSPDATLPKAEFGDYPEEAKVWLKASPVVQSDDPEIVAKALELKKGCADVEQFARKVIAFTSTNQGTGQAFVALDAKSALGSGGSCTSRSNLGAALLRAGGVPARTVPHLPTWAFGSGLYEHWLTEYWHPGVGWVWLETTLGKFQPDSSTIATLAVASMEDEQKAGQDGQYGWIMHGVAWMSGIQGFGDLRSSGSGDENNASWCKPERRMDVSEALFREATATWPRVTAPDYVSKMDRAAMTGSTSEIESLLKKR